MSASANDLFSLGSKTILVTGGTRGIGAAVSLRFARAGATVIANYLRNDKAAEDLRAIAEGERLAIVLCRADLTNERGFEQLERLLQEQCSHLSGLVHCAATGIHRPIEELSERHFDWTFNLNVRAFFKLTKLLMPRFSEGSSIVAVSSWGAVRALPCYSLIGSSKGALEALARHRQLVSAA
jgi:enoyl-[acyl-carrier protein] reductase III